MAKHVTSKLENPFRHYYILDKSSNMLSQVDIPELNGRIYLLNQDVLRMELGDQKHQLITGSYFLGFIHDDQRALEVLNQLHDQLQSEGSMIIKESVAEEDEDTSM